MSEDEKKAIKIIREDIEVYKEKGAWKENSILVKSLRTLLNLIEKQQNELQQEKEKNTELKEMIERRIDYTSKLEKDLFENCSNYVVSKDKIKDMQRYREFELQQEYKDFENDVEWKTYNKILEED